MPEKATVITKDRVGQKVRPNASYYYRPTCIVESSSPSLLYGVPDTLHVVAYPNNRGAVYVWESEWPGRFEGDTAM